MAKIIARPGRFDTEFPADGSKALHRRAERLAQYVAEGELTREAIAKLFGIGRATVFRAIAHPLIKARIAFLREQLRASAYDAEPLVDKRNRVIMAGALARTLHQEGEANGWRDTIAVTKAGLPITGLDWRRTDQVRQLLDYIAKEVGDRNTTPASTTNVGVSISMEDAAVRVAALFSRMPDMVEGEVIPDALTEGGVEGQPPEHIR